MKPSVNPLRSDPRKYLRYASLFLAMSTGVFVSCASIDATTTQYVGAKHSAPSDPSTVSILRTEPIKPHERLGEITIDASVHPSPPITDVEARLCKEAARIGAEAVVVVYDRVQPMGVYVSGGYWNRSTTTITGHKLVGVAIKYQP
jgi:hypothetical protein